MTEKELAQNYYLYLEFEPLLKKEVKRLNKQIEEIKATITGKCKWLKFLKKEHKAIKEIQKHFRFKNISIKTTRNVWVVINNNVKFYSSLKNIQTNTPVFAPAYSYVQLEKVLSKFPLFTGADFEIPNNEICDEVDKYHSIMWREFNQVITLDFQELKNKIDEYYDNTNGFI
ncbi:hypothetical protein [Mycoplasmopsis pullorum]|uniref:Uncharacterized protein n=1 Tax=Mycoplasmopsis pullorum TaxID=48003 RepID=A0A1L4FSB1_9BACT|nr:hypothetical protein [Mycoplasmopsis pullorum]APJ38498.1 hypothetical protein BLA55_02410 [Mycoplasmopsis pullorum]